MTATKSKLGPQPGSLSVITPPYTGLGIKDAEYEPSTRIKTLQPPAMTSCRGTRKPIEGITIGSASDQPGNVSLACRRRLGVQDPFRRIFPQHSSMMMQCINVMSDVDHPCGIDLSIVFRTDQGFLLFLVSPRGRSLTTLRMMSSCHEEFELVAHSMLPPLLLGLRVLLPLEVHPQILVDSFPPLLFPLPPDKASVQV